MAIETYANLYKTALSGNGGSISSGATTIHLASGTGAPSGKARFAVDNELIVGSVSGTTLTATIRGAEGTTAASHLDGATIAQVLTAASLLAEPGGMTTSGDLPYMSATLQPARLAIGTTGQVLAVSAGLPSWINQTTPLNNEAQAGILINATSTGDAGNRSDHFTAGSLSGAWSSFGSAPSYAMGESAIDFSSSSTDGGYSQPYTPSGAFAIDFRFAALGADLMEAGVYYFDGTNYTVWGAAIQDTTAFTAGNVSGISTTGSNTTLATAIANLSFHSSATQQIDMTKWVYLRISNDGSGNWTAQIGPDRVTWLYTVTVASALSAVTGLWFGTHGTVTLGALDFVDVVE